MNQIIVLHVHGPNVPSLDVVDMPGLIMAAAAAAGLWGQTLIDQQVEQDKACLMYLAVVPAGQLPNTLIKFVWICGFNFTEFEFVWVCGFNFTLFKSQRFLNFVFAGNH